MTKIDNGLTLASVKNTFEIQQQYQWVFKRTSASQRIERLTALKEALVAREQVIKDALYTDLRKSATAVDTELNSCYTDLDDAIDNLQQWMTPLEVTPSARFQGATAKVMYEPLGQVLLFGPWNFPFNLIIQPLVAIVAAGNCAIVKPNEMARATSAVTTEIIRAVFDEQEVAVFEGGVDLANALLELPFNHIFFTGSPNVGKLVMTAAAKHLASVTLELGGKNPVIIDRSANIQEAAGKLAVFRNVNNGQVCLCPENIWVPEEKLEEFLAVVQATYQAMFYVDGKLNGDATGKIIDQRNLMRVKGYIDDAVGKGATLVCGGVIEEEDRIVHPTVLTNIPDNAAILGEETFGPILSVFTYNNVNEAIESIQQQPKPLALYVFSSDSAVVDTILESTSSGGVTVNNCMLHCAEHNLPFGGVNHSGIGRYHGIHGFKELSHERAVLLTP